MAPVAVSVPCDARPTAAECHPHSDYPEPTQVPALVLTRAPGRAFNELSKADREQAAPAVWRAFRRLWGAGLVHGDVAGRNIMVVMRGDGGADVTIIDLGCARRLGRGPDSIDWFWEDAGNLSIMTRYCPDDWPALLFSVFDAPAEDKAPAVSAPLPEAA